MTNLLPATRRTIHTAKVDGASMDATPVALPAYGDRSESSGRPVARFVGTLFPRSTAGWSRRDSIPPGATTVTTGRPPRRWAQHEHDRQHDDPRPVILDSILARALWRRLSCFARPLVAGSL